MRLTPATVSLVLHEPLTRSQPHKVTKRSAVDCPQVPDCRNGMDNLPCLIWDHLHVSSTLVILPHISLQ